MADLNTFSLPSAAFLEVTSPLEREASSVTWIRHAEISIWSIDQVGVTWVCQVGKDTSSTPRTANICDMLAFSYLYHAAINVLAVVKSPSHIPFRSNQPG